ncbi:putative metal-binding motif-containing protein [Myxococcota bacterium]|nr:putative metal-binding motif-containing protein [Myxococcota bacterium]
MLHRNFGFAIAGLTAGLLWAPGRAQAETWESPEGLTSSNVFSIYAFGNVFEVIIPVRVTGVSVAVRDDERACSLVAGTRAAGSDPAAPFTQVWTGSAVSTDVGGIPYLFTTDAAVDLEANTEVFLGATCLVEPPETRLGAASPDPGPWADILGLAYSVAPLTAGTFSVTVGAGLFLQTYVEFHLDADGDGQHADQDCDDGDPTVHPGAPDACDGEDGDCDGLVDEGYDSDGDGFTSCGGDCDDSRADVYPGASEACDGLDQDCDGTPGSGEIDGDGDGHRPCDGDCDDAQPWVFPGAPEACDGADQDCDGVVDDDLDGDADGVSACDGDCDDTDPDVGPGVPEDCADGRDGDCDGWQDAEDTDCAPDDDGDAGDEDHGGDDDGNDEDEDSGAHEGRSGCDAAGGLPGSVPAASWLLALVLMGARRR